MMARGTAEKQFQHDLHVIGTDLQTTVPFRQLGAIHSYALLQPVKGGSRKKITPGAQLSTILEGFKTDICPSLAPAGTKFSDDSRLRLPHHNKPVLTRTSSQRSDFSSQKST